MSEEEEFKERLMAQPTCLIDGCEKLKHVVKEGFEMAGETHVLCFECIEGVTKEWEKLREENKDDVL